MSFFEVPPPPEIDETPSFDEPRIWSLHFHEHMQEMESDADAGSDAKPESS